MAVYIIKPKVFNAFAKLFRRSSLSDCFMASLSSSPAQPQDHDIESGVVPPAKEDGSRPTIFSIEPCQGYQDDHDQLSQSPKVMIGSNFDQVRNRSTAQPSLEVIVAIVAIGCTLVVGLMTVNFPYMNGRHNDASQSPFLDRHPMFSFSFVVIAAATFYFIAIAAVICPLHPTLSRTLNLAALVLAVLAVTLLLWAFLPKAFRWVPWIFFAITILAALLVQIYEWATRSGAASDIKTWVLLGS